MRLIKPHENVMPKKNLTAEEKRRFAKVAALGCYIWNHFPDYQKECGGRAEIHHKLGEGRNHAKVTCLCTNHHSAQTPLPFGYAVHKGTKSFVKRYTDEQTMVNWADENVST